jgi:hypothetical protein
MKRILMTLTVLTAVVASAIAQKIGVENSDRTRIVHLKTAINHLTVIEVAEPVVEVAAGSPSFKVEWRDNKIFVQPTEADAATNLFVWTATQRLNYELEPAGAVSAMDFAVDQAPARRPEPPKPASTQPQTMVSPSLTDLLLTEKPVRTVPSKKNQSRPVQVLITDLFEKDDRLLIRYAVSNHGSQPFRIDSPQVYQLDGVRSPQSLYAFVNSQLGEGQISKLRAKQETPVKVLDEHLRSSQIAPGEEVVGVLAVQLGASPTPIVLRLDFPSLPSSGGDADEGKERRITAFLVR